MREAIRRAVEVIAPGGVVEVRALADASVHSGYFDDREILAERAEVLDADPSVAGIYVTLNPVNPALLARRANRIKMRLGKKDATTADADILRRRWLPVDIDPVRPSGVSSTDVEHDLALATAEKIAAWLAEQGFPAPVRADSGNGAHLLYRVDLPNDEAATDLVRNCLATLDALFSNEKVTVDTANYNASRIWKLYGTASRKGDNTAERPHRRAKLLAVPDELAVVSPERLTRLAGLLPQDEPPAPKTSGPGIDLAGWLCDHGIAVRSAKPYRGGTLYVLEDCPFSSAHKDGAFAIQFANGAIFAGCHHTSCGGGAQRWPELRARFEQWRKRTQKKDARVEEIPSSPPAPERDEYRQRALAILQDGDPLAFMLDTFNKTHVGDRIVAECLIMSLASQSVENTSGLHVAISGNSGKGKTHACVTMLKQVPEQYRLAGTVSDKALYYNDRLQPGTVFLFDDVSLSDDLQEVLKAATANFRERIEHHTLTVDRHLRICSLPERCVWWLAKVESLGDDQVANRMLTVWIDDSAEQDRRVLAHLKQREADEGSDAETDKDLLVCRAIWEIIKQQIVRVSIPFSRRVQFTNSANRRNPAILFDLIKCHAALRFLQRERFGAGEGCIGIRATREDFAAASRIYAAINGEVGGQETKLTRNEAAALKTVAAMGTATFTVRQLQQAMGLSYQNTRRVLQGYVSRGTVYAGLLEKCPAISCVDTTVTEDGCGCTIRRREYYYTFDIEVYRTWAGGTAVWLEDDPGGDNDDDDDSISADLQQTFSTCCQSQTDLNEPNSSNNPCTDEKRLSQYSYIQQTGGTEHPGVPPARPSGCVCESRSAEDETEKSPENVDYGASSMQVRDFSDSTCCQRAENDCLPLSSIAPAASILLPVAKTKQVGVLPLPGLLDHRTFERTCVDLGRCTICDTAKAVYRSREAQAKICEGCYARLVREWNRKEGVR